MTKVVLADIGARGGIDQRWFPYHSLIEVIAFEADAAECIRLQERQFPYQIRFLPYALGAKDGESATMYICRKPGCSSFHRPNQDLCGQFRYAAHMEVVDQRPMTLSRLDTVCLEQPDIIKIDTQGTELDILEGAGRLLQGTMAVELEVEFVQQYAGQALFGDIDVFMRRQGFTLRGIRRTCWRNIGRYTHAYGGQLVHGDVLYLRPERMNCPKGHIILAAYRQYDLLANFDAHHLIPDRGLFTRFFARMLSGYSHRRLRSIIDSLRPADVTDWHDPDFF